MDQYLMLGMIAVIFGGMWWMSSRARKQQQEQAAFRDHLQPGQEVMTGSGAYGIVVEVESDTVILELSPGVETRWAKAAIHKLVESDAAAEDEPDDDAVADETGESTDGADGDSSESNSDGR